MTVTLSKNATGKYILTIDGEPIILETPISPEFDKALSDANLMIIIQNSNMTLGSDKQ